VSDDIDHHAESAALLSRADILLARRKIAANTTPVIPVLTEMVGSNTPVDTTTIPTLIEIVAPQPSVAPANGVITQLSRQILEQTVYRKLKWQFDQKIAGMSQQPSASEVAAMFNQALRQLSGELNMDIDAMVRASVEEALRSRINEPQDAPVKVHTPPDSSTPK
jgi:hypothetical protein